MLEEFLLIKHQFRGKGKGQIFPLHTGKLNLNTIQELFRNMTH